MRPGSLTSWLQFGADSSEESHALRDGMLLGLACFSTAILGLRLELPGLDISPLWLPAGIGIGGIIVGGLRLWPAVLVSVLAAIFLIDGIHFTGVAEAIGTTLEAVVGATLFLIPGRRASFRRLRGVLWYLIAAGVIASLIGATIEFLIALPDGVQSARVFALSWTGDMLGAILAGPLVVVWGSRDVALSRGRAEWIGLLLLTLGVGLSMHWSVMLAYPHLLFIPVIWAALRFGFRGTTLVTLALAVAFVAASLWEQHPGGASPNLLAVITRVTLLAVTGLIIASVTVERQIADRKRFRENAVQRALIAAAPLGIVGIGLDGMVRVWNQASERIFGYSRDDMLGQPLPPELQGFGSNKSGFHDAALAGEAVSGVPVRRSRKDGSVLSLSLSSAPLRDEAGRIAGTMEIFADLTERELADEKIRQSEARLKLILGQALDAVITMDQVGNINGWNSQAETIFGWPEAEVMGKRLSTLIIPPRYREAHEAAFRRVVAGGESRLQGQRIEITALRRDGGEFPVELTVASARLGGEILFSAFVRDITERKRAETALTESEDRYRAFVSQSSEAIWCFDLEQRMPPDLTEDDQIDFFYRHGYLSHCNDAMARMYGLAEAKDLVGMRLRETLIPEDPRNIEYLRAFIQSHYRLSDAESHEVDAEGRTKYFLNNLVGIFKDGVLYRVWGTQRDITERKTMEERTAAFAALSQQLSGAKSPEEAGRTIVEAARGLCGWDSAALDLYSADSDRLTAVLTVDTVDGVTRDFPAPARVSLPGPITRRVMTEGPQLILRSNDDAPSQGLTPFGNTGRRSASLMFVPIRNRAEVIGILTIQCYKVNAYSQRDLSLLQALADHCGAALSRIRAEQELHRTEQQLQHAQRMEAVGRLAGGVAHDFNNLLTTILGTSDLLMEDVPAESPWREDLQEIKRAGERAAGLTRQLLAFSRKQVIEATILDLNEVVTGVAKMLKRLIGEDVELIARTSADLGMIRADSGQLEQVIMNLAVNARDAMPNGGRLFIETANVELDAVNPDTWATVPPGSYVMLTVSDTGVGMDSDTREHIFEPFFTTKEKGKGTGLGLAMVYGIVRQSGGRIVVASEPGAGTVFRVYLPRVDSNVRPERSSGPTQPVAGWETILLAEDEPSVRALARRILEAGGYVVLPAASGDEALRIATSHEGPIHLLVTDVIMPGMSGPQLAERLAKVRREARVLFMSGYTDSTILHHGVLKDGLSHLQKPFSPGALKEKVRDVLDGTNRH